MTAARIGATLVLAALIVSPITAPAAWPTGDTNVSIEYQQSRRFTVHIPPGYDGSVPVPLVVDLHAYTSDPDQQQALSGFAQLADANGFIVAYPEGSDPDPDGLHRGWNVGSHPGLSALGAGLDDVGFVRAVVTDIRQQANIDPARIYATGISNGGGLAHRLGCEASDVFAAVAPIAFPLAATPFAVCQPLRPIPVFAVAGLTDEVVPYAGGLSTISPEITFPFPSANDSFAYWVAANGCGGGSPDVLEDLGNGAGCDTYTACLGAVDVALCRVHGTMFYGHLLYSNSDGFLVAQRAWDFFSRFTLPTGLALPNACAAAKTKAAGKEAACLLGVDAKGTSRGEAADVLARKKCHDALLAGFTSAETKPPCPTSGDGESIDDRIEALAASSLALLAPALPAASACGAAKLKAVAKEAKCLLGMRAKQLQKGAPPAADKIEKCVAGTSAAFAKAEAGAVCVANGDASALEGDVGTAVTDVVCRLAGACP